MDIDNIAFVNKLEEKSFVTDNNAEKLQRFYNISIPVAKTHTWSLNISIQHYVCTGVLVGYKLFLLRSLIYF